MAENKQLDDNTTLVESPSVEVEGSSTDGVIRVVGSKEEDDEIPNKRQYNPLSKFSSYTYSLSLYATTPDSYNNWNVTGKWLTKDLELLVQSGGINKSLDSKRNRHFDLDFTIDDLEIVSLISGKSTRTSSNQSNFKFKIFEPYGMTFTSRLVKAQAEIQSQANIKRDIKQQIQALLCPLLLVIRFYGYDENGTLVKNMDDPDKNGYTKTDTNANFERAFPIIISKFSFKLDNKVTVYDVEAKMINEQIGFGVQRGVIKTGFEITADTVSTAITQLMDKINKQQTELTNPPKDPNKEQKQKIADIYKVVFENNSGIAESLIVDKDYYAKHYAPMTRVTNADEVTVRKSNSGSARTVNKGNRVIKFAESTSIMTAIDQIITQSTFVKNSLDELDREEIKKKQPQDSTTVKTSDPMDLYWYHVRPSTKIIGYDYSRNDYAYEIVYNIIKYRIPYIQTLYLDKSTKYHGPHKIYEYYYSGQNTEIIDYNITYNLAYYNLGALASKASSATNPNNTTINSQEPGQDANPTGKLPGTNELVNSLKTYLYSPSDQIKANITILGDPDYLMPSQAGSEENLFKLWYGNDFTINPSSGEVFIEIGFKQVEDYNNESGTLDPNGDIVFWTYPQGSDIEKQTQGRMVYMLNTVTNRFSNGTFKQELKSVIPSFANQPGREGGLRADSNQSQAEVNRLLNYKQQPNIVAKAQPPSIPASTTSSNKESMGVYKPRFTQQVNDDNAPVTIKSLDKVNNFQLEEYRKKLTDANNKDSVKPSRVATGRLEGK